MLSSNQGNLTSETRDTDKPRMSRESDIIPPELINSYQNRLKGHSSYPRQEILLLSNYLTDAEYLLYTVIRDIIVDWDDRHPKFGKFSYDINQLVYVTSWNSSKVRRLFNQLKLKGLVRISHSPTKLFELIGYGEYKELQKFKGLTDNPFKHVQSFLNKINQNRVVNNTNIGRYYANLKKHTEDFIESFASFSPKSSSSSNKSSTNIDKNKTCISDEEIATILNDIKEGF